MELHGGKPMGLFVQCIFDLHYFYGSLSVPQTCAGTAGDELFLAAARYHQRCDSGKPRHAVYRAGFAELKRWCQGRDEVSVERYHDPRCGSSCGIIGIFCMGLDQRTEISGENPLVSECAVDCSGNCTLYGSNESGACKACAFQLFRQHRICLSGLRLSVLSGSHLV